ncbi:hypothetical protein MKX01_008275 [Papaver californicum]|nr:hypothetical protein MKX01_008275 [Papaver californicum]
MAGSSAQKVVRNGLASLSLGAAKKSGWSDKMSGNSSTSGSTSRKNPYHCNPHSFVVDQWIAEVYTNFHNKLKNLVVGLEWSRRSRDNNISARNKVAVLQLCLSKHCLIFQISCCDCIPESLASNEKFIFVGARIDGDAHKLWFDHGLTVGRTEEVGSLADYKLTKTIGEYRERADFIKLELPKQRDIQLSNWGVTGFLSEKQIEYACLDAFVSFKLAIDLISRVNPVHINERRGKAKKLFKDPEPKKAEEEEETKQVSDKANGTKSKQETTKQVSEKKANGTKSKTY